MLLLQPFRSQSLRKDRFRWKSAGLRKLRERALLRLVSGKQQTEPVAADWRYIPASTATGRASFQQFSSRIQWAMAEPSNDAVYCRDRVVRFDPDRAAAIAFQPAGARSALYALHAFSLEVAHLRETVGEPVLGAMRLQWWRDALDELASGRERRHAVLQPLAAAMRAHDLPPEYLRRLLDARETDLETAPPADLPAYARDTGGTLAALAGQVVSGRAGSEDIGTAWALVGWLRAAAFFRWTLPEGAEARSIAEEAAALLTPAPDSYGRALSALTRAYIRKLRRLDYDLGDARAAEPLRLRGWRIVFGRR